MQSIDTFIGDRDSNEFPAFYLVYAMLRTCLVVSWYAGCAVVIDSTLFRGNMMQRRHLKLMGPYGIVCQEVGLFPMRS